MRDDKLTSYTASRSDYFDGYERGYEVGKQDRAGRRFVSFTLGFVLCWFIVEVLRHVW